MAEFQGLLLALESRSHNGEQVSFEFEAESGAGNCSPVRGWANREGGRVTICLRFCSYCLFAWWKQSASNGGRRARPSLGPSCTDCSHAHVQYAVSGRRAISCTFAGAIRPVLLDVMYCTDYRDRSAAPRLVSIGFAHEVVDAGVANEVAIV